MNLLKVISLPYGKPENLGKTIDYHLTNTLNQALKPNPKTDAVDIYKALTLAVKDCIMPYWQKSIELMNQPGIRRIYYLSFEYLPGRVLSNNLLNLQYMEPVEKEIHQRGFDINMIEDKETDLGLGNGGLGRLAACILESIASNRLPGMGYGLWYQWGIFEQLIRGGVQKEQADRWYSNPDLRLLNTSGNNYEVNYGGSVIQRMGGLREPSIWTPASVVKVENLVLPIIGDNGFITSLKLWKAPIDVLNFSAFNEGNYNEAIQNTGTFLTSVLYPNDQELRLKQQYLLVSASLQDIIKQFEYVYGDLTESFATLPDFVCIQINDTHPTLVIPELLRILIDEKNVPWEEAVNVVRSCVNYTNHTILPEALEKWPLDMISRNLPRHVQIIFELNELFREDVMKKFPGDIERWKRLTIINKDNDSVDKIYMGNLAVAFSQKVNGVSALHTEILKDSLFTDFHELYPNKIKNVTNGITFKRWIDKSNKGLDDFICKRIGKNWKMDSEELKALNNYANDPDSIHEFNEIKRANKEKLTELIYKHYPLLDDNGRIVQRIHLNPNSIFDVHAKRIHLYKRQLLNAMHILLLYNDLKKNLVNNPDFDFVPRSFIFAGKAASGYREAKDTIQFINLLARVINNDPDINGRIQIVFVPNYSVSLAEKIIPAADVSEQISTAGYEASGTGNMKFALNGALTIGTLDGANIEILENVGNDNIYIFGKTTEEVKELHRLPNPYNRTKDIMIHNPQIKTAINSLWGLTKNTLTEDDEEKKLLYRIADLLVYNDPHFVLYDLQSYTETQERLSTDFRDRIAWGSKGIKNSANMAFFDGRRVVRQYAEDIWGVNPL